MLRHWIVSAVWSFVLLGAAQAQPAAQEQKVLRYAFLVAETGFDPAQISDLYSAIVTAHIFDAPYRYDHLARPYKIQPNTAAAMPEVSADFKTWTVRLKPGTYFADDPVFKGKKRELVAQDYVYSIKRIFDPATKSPRYSGFNGAVAREVIEGYPGKAMEHPVGSGPFRLVEWRRSSKMVLERNPNFREMLYDAEPNAGDVQGQAYLKRFKGRRLPMIDRVEISVIEESQPRWLAFLSGQFDLAWGVPLEFVNQAAPNGKVAPNLAKRGIRLYRDLAPDRAFFYFNMEDPIVGGLSAEKVALRRAISLATDIDREVKVIRRGQAVPAQSIIAPYTYGYDTAYRSENSEYDPARAKALLDMYGYVDRDGDGWREQPDGKPLVISYATTPDGLSRQFDELWKKNLDAVGLRTEFNIAKWPEQLKKARAGQLMVWMLGQSAEAPDVQDAFDMVYGPSSGGQNLARFKMPAFDALYEHMQDIPDGPERLADVVEANKLLTAYMPQRYTVHRISTDMSYPWLLGFRRPTFANQWWQYVDIDNSQRPRH